MGGQEIFCTFLGVATLLAPVYLLAGKMPKRNKFALRTSLSISAVLLIYFLFTVIASILTKKGLNEYLIWIHIMKYMSMYILSGVCVKLCFDCEWWGAGFCANAGYCVQHVAARIGSIFEDFLLKESYLVYKVHWVVVTLLSLVIAAAIITLFYLVYVRKIKKNTKFVLTDKSQVFIATFVIGISIIYNSFGISYATGSILQAEQNGLSTSSGYGSLMFVYIMTMVIAFLALALNCGLRSNKELSTEMDELKSMLEESKRQYELEKKNIELINIKCHDLKHQLGAMKGKIYEEQIDELKNIIEIYDSSVKTGNEALDVVLTQKNLYCSQHGIRLTCFLNGKNYDFIPRHETYSLFTNIIDNAIVAVEKLPEEKRIISITEREAKGFLTVRAENYYSGKVEFDGELPVSSKNSNDHGFGIKSMKLIAEKYGGGVAVNADGEKFMLDIYFIVAKNAI